MNSTNGTDDIEETVKIDLQKMEFETNQKSKVDLKMSSDSLNFIFINQFGFDTLTVNGCFDEKNHGGFIKSIKSIGIPLLNNNGYKINFRFLFNIRLIFNFFRSVIRVKQNLA